MSNVSRPHVITAILLTLGILVALCVMAPRMQPLNPGTSANFWYATTGVNLGATPLVTHQVGALAVFDRDRFVYGSQYIFYAYPDFPYETISEKEAEIDFPRVQRELASRAALKDPYDNAAAGYVHWSAITGWNGGIPGLINCIDMARQCNGYSQRPPLLANTHIIYFKQGLMHVSQAARLYWVCFVFEFLFFSAIIWFGFWPYIHRASTWRKLVHVAAMPLLLCLPLWFGYCNSASPAFPIGGILYPFVYILTLVSPTNFNWEFYFLAQFPPFLSVITQGRAVTFADYPNLRTSIPYQIGPVNVAILSIILTAITAFYYFALPAFNKFRARHSPQGFPVLNVHPTDAPVNLSVNKEKLQR